MHKDDHLSNPYMISKQDKITPAAIDFLRQRGIEIKWSNSNVVQEKSIEEQFIPVGVSNRHIHLSVEDLFTLFGEGYELTKFKNLSQSGQFAARETITLLGPKGFIKDVRILGPCRGSTQVEISRSDSFQLGIQPPIRLSGDIEETPGITMIGPGGHIVLSKGVIIAKCHVHMSPDDASKFIVQDGESITLKSLGERPIVFSDVKVRVHPNYSLDFHIDMDEGNAANLKTGEYVQVVKV
ncbi:phosphate propanoyltransferase [Bacillus massiliigorillae]|uniref:phosphate propanoyltransferase n=1 Tax=Bacillus massiliigorillae TaxID=1243664 RepID=UPI003F6B921E